MLTLDRSMFHAQEIKNSESKVNFCCTISKPNIYLHHFLSTDSFWVWTATREDLCFFAVDNNTNFVYDL